MLAVRGSKHKGAARATHASVEHARPSTAKRGEGAQERAAAEVRSACDSVAFFFVKNHGVPKDMLEGIIEESARFHAQPMEEKWKVKVDTEMSR